VAGEVPADDVEFAEVGGDRAPQAVDAGAQRGSDDEDRTAQPSGQVSGDDLGCGSAHGVWLQIADGCAASGVTSIVM
jgi:hypothetical protein